MKFEKTKHPLYWTWRGMLLRCSSNHLSHFYKYKGRGIVVCARWLDFENFLADMGPKPSPLHSVERVDNAGNYEPSNCRWATKSEQSRNRRYNRRITFNGKTQLLIDWAAELNIRVSTLSMRINRYGWPIEKALSTPGRSYRAL